jgi:hypothetical protein
MLRKTEIQVPQREHVLALEAAPLPRLEDLSTVVAQLLVAPALA